MRKLSTAIDRGDLQVVVWIGDIFAGCSVSNLEIDDILGRFVDQMMCVTGTSRKSRTHAWHEYRATFVSYEGRLSLK